MRCVQLKISMSDKHHRHSEHTKFHQNLRGSLQFFGDWAWNYPMNNYCPPSSFTNLAGLPGLTTEYDAWPVSGWPADQSQQLGLNFSYPYRHLPHLI